VRVNSRRFLYHRDRVVSFLRSLPDAGGNHGKHQ
jgi:hypothetical protein